MEVKASSVISTMVGLEVWQGGGKVLRVGFRELLSGFIARTMLGGMERWKRGCYIRMVGVHTCGKVLRGEFRVFRV